MEDGKPNRTLPVRIMLRPLGSPLPLGFFAFAVGVALTAIQELGALPASEVSALALVGLAFCAPLELGAVVFALLARDGAAATLLGVFGASWVVYAISWLRFGAGTSQPTLAVLSWALAVVCFLIALAARSAKPFFALLVLIAAARFILLGFFELSPHDHAVARATGLVGLALAALAFYGAEALLMEDMRRQTVLPLFRREAARRALEADLPEQVAKLEQEAGVRQQL